MLHMDLIVVGRVKERFLQDGIAEYAKRLRPYVRLEIIEVDDEPCDGDELNAKAREGERILKRIGAGDRVIALDRLGEMPSSTELADSVKEWEMAGAKVVFVIGGSAGLSDDVLKRADRKVSFSKLTFPHQLFRLMWVEQIYRAFKIARGERYHK